MNKKTTPNSLTHEAILEFFKRPDYTPMTVAELAAALSVPGRQRDTLEQLLHKMVMNGEIVTLRKNRYALGEMADLVTGRLEIKRSGDGYLTNQEGDRQVKIDRGNVGTALPGDLVVVRLELPREGAPDKQRHGQVIRIVERARRVVVGTLRSAGRFLVVAPIDPSYQQDFYVPDAKGAQANDRVVVQFTNWDSQHVNPEAEIIEVIGPADNPSLDTLAVMRNYELPEEFPIEVMHEAESTAARMDLMDDRLDLRGKFIFTVDPATAKDFDDALSLERDDKGLRVLGVHIADVSHFVMQGGALDQEAIQRGNSVYLPDKVIPMLPEELSNGLCSLKPGQDRMAFSAFMTFDEVGRMVGARFARSVIHSKLRLNYEQALEVIQTPPGMRCPVPDLPGEALPLIRDICELAMQLRQRRLQQNALDIDLPESQVVIGADGMIEDIHPLVNDISHQMIEECMVAANEAVDREVSARGMRLIHRLHEPPTEEKLEGLAEELKDMGYQPGNLNQRGMLVQFARKIRNTPLAHAAQMAILRSMKRAVYSSKAGGHFGLAKKYYAHFTSPIRRYPDLVVHRILAAALLSKANPYPAEELERLAVHCSETEQTAQEAERELLEIKKYRFLARQLEDHKTRVYEAVVVRVMNFGLFVELDELDIQGLLHVSALSDQFVRFDAGAKALRAGNDVYKQGTRVNVTVTGVDFEKRRIDFALCQEKGRETKATSKPGPGPSTRRNGRGSRPQSRGRSRR
jgi:ribonuclease R